MNTLVTGGTGSFGQAFVADVLATDSGARVVVYSRDELKQSQMRAQFAGDARLRFFLGDICDTARLKLALRGVETVIHAAALKQIDTCEANPSECVRTNVDGTQSVISACLAAGVRRAVFLSTDKAAAPNTLYGASKLCAERLWVQANVYAAGTPTKFSATRYGNVIASRGSVVEVWRRQAAQGDPLTITDARCTRFWMTLPDAVSLVRLALSRMRGGEVFVPKCGAAPITVLADVVAGPVDQFSTGLRRGEKIHETLISEDEARDCYEYGSHYVIEPERTWGEVAINVSGELVPGGFSFTSALQTLSRSDLRRMVGW